MANVLISGSLRLSTTNTPTRIGDVVETVNDIYNIPTPYIGQVVYVTSTDKYYYVSELQAATTGFGSIPNSKVKTYKSFSSSDLENRVSNLEIVSTSIKVKSIKDNDSILKVSNDGTLSSTLKLVCENNKIILKGIGDKEISSVELQTGGNYTTGSGLVLEDNKISLVLSSDENNMLLLTEDGLSVDLSEVILTLDENVDNKINNAFTWVEV